MGELRLSSATLVLWKAKVMVETTIKLPQSWKFIVKIRVLRPQGYNFMVKQRFRDLKFANPW